MLVRALIGVLVLSWSAQARFLPPQQLLDPLGAANDNFGWSVAIDGDTLVVGAPSDDVGANADQGSASVYRWTGTGWAFEATLTAPDGAANDSFGASVAIDGDTVVVGVAGDDVGANSNQGSTRVFVRSGSTWTQQATLTAPDGAAIDQFGWSVAIDGDTVVVGVNADDVGANSNQGSARVFVRSGSTWTQQAVLTAPDGAANDELGWFVAIDGGTVVVGARGDDVGANSNQGSARVFVRSGSTWTQQATLTAPDGATNDFPGGSVAIDRDTVVVGSANDDVGANGDQGSARIFVRSGSTWTQQATLAASDGAANDQFGWSVAIDGGTAVVGAYVDDVGANSNQGSARVFVRSGSTWAQQATLTAPDGAANDLFGSAVTIDGDMAVVGGWNDQVGATIGQGSARTFSRAGSAWVGPDFKLLAPDGAAFDRFGSSVAIDGDTAVIGARFDDVGAIFEQGSARVFVRSGSTWTQQATLTAPDGAELDQLGLSAAIDGFTVVVGANVDTVGANANQGSARVFVRSGSTWTQQAVLTAPDGAANDELGRSVAIDGDTVVVGAYFDNVGANSNQGSARVFVRSGSTWTQQAVLTAPDGAADDLFGRSVAIDGDTAVVGAYFDDVGANSNQGSARVFVRSGSIWTQQATLTGPDGAADDLIGYSVAIDGETVVVGALGDDVGAITAQGTARVFVRSGSTWTLRALLTAPDGAGADEFGVSVAIDDGTVLVGASAQDVGANLSQGSAYVFSVPYQGFSLAHNVTLDATYSSLAAAFIPALSGHQITATEAAWAQVGTLDTLGRALGLYGSEDVRAPSTSFLTLANGSTIITPSGTTIDIFGQLRTLSGASIDLFTDAFRLGSRGILTARTGSSLTINAADVRLDGQTRIEQGASLTLAGDATAIGPITASDNFNLTAGGTLTNIDVCSLTAGTLSAPLYRNRAVTNIFGSTAIFGSFTNDVGATTTIRSGTLFVFGSLTNNGTIVGAICSGCLDLSTPNLDVGGKLALGSDASLTMPFATSVVRVGGDFDCAINANTRYDMSLATLLLEGAGSAQQLEVMSRDIGPDQSGLDRTIAGHYPIGTLRLGPTPTVVTLVDTHDNDTLGQAACEAIYVDELIIDAGSSLINPTCRIYYNTLTSNGSVSVPANLVQLTPPCTVAGDANGDDAVNGADLSVLLSQFGQSVTPGTGADFNGDGLVNGADLSVLLANFGVAC